MSVCVCVWVVEVACVSVSGWEGCVYGERRGDGVEGRGERLPYNNTRLVVMVCVDIRLQYVELS